MSKSLPLPLYGLAGLSALFASAALFLPSSPSPVNSVVTSRSPQAAPPKTRFENAESLLISYFGSSATTETGFVAPREVHSVRALIGLIPDPYDSHVDYKYDAYIEAYRRALGEAGYFPDRFWLPWPHEDTAASRRGPRDQ